MTAWQRFHVKYPWQYYHSQGDPRTEGDIGSWTLTPHHIYIPSTATLYLGSGEERHNVTATAFSVIDTFAGGSLRTDGIGDGTGDGQARNAVLWGPMGIAVAPDGALYIADVLRSLRWDGEYTATRIRRVSPDGRTVTTFAGIGNICLGSVACNDGYNEDDIPAAQAKLNAAADVAVGPDGSVYIADFANHRVRRVDPNPPHNIHTIAGNGREGNPVDGDEATASALRYPIGVAVAANGDVYIATYGPLTGGDWVTAGRILRVRNRRITTVAGGGALSPDGERMQATRAIIYPTDVAVRPGDHPDAFYFTNSTYQTVMKVNERGEMTTVATLPYLISYAERSPAGLVVAEDGTIITAVPNSNSVVRIGLDGTQTRWGSQGIRDYYYTSPDREQGLGDGSSGVGAVLDAPRGVALGPNGTIYIADRGHQRIRRILPTLTPDRIADSIVASSDGSEVYVFASNGQHKRTVDALTGATLYSFTYDRAGRLVAIEDADRNRTTIARTPSTGYATEIVAPFGRQGERTTTIETNGLGWPTKITNPGSNNGFVRLDYDAGNRGLLTSMTDIRSTDARRLEHVYEYEDDGRLKKDMLKDANRIVSSQTLTRLSSPEENYGVTVTTEENRVTTYDQQWDVPGNETRVITDPNGGATTLTRARNRDVFSSSRPDSMTSSETQGPDPRFGMQSPMITDETVSTPGTASSPSRRLTTAKSQTVTLDTPEDPLSLSALTETESINGAAFTRTYDASTRTMTLRTAEGRVITHTLDVKGRISRIAVPDLTPVDLIYDSSGRIEQLRQGVEGAPGTRVVRFGYDPASGYLETITDPLNRVTRYERDATGRVRAQTLPPGNRQVSFDYDKAGNLTAMTPPGRSTYSFTYTPFNAFATFEPPAIGLPQSQTVYEYNRDQQLTNIRRPDGQVVTFNYNYNPGKRLSSLGTVNFANTFRYVGATNRVESIGAPGGQGLRFEYDGELRTGITWQGPVEGNISVTYNDNFQVVALSVNGSAVAYQYDQDGLITRAGPLTLSRHRGNGRLEGSSVDSITTEQTWTDFGEIATSIAKFGQTDVYSLDTTSRDDLGRIKDKVESIAGETIWVHYDYDLAGRLWKTCPVAASPAPAECPSRPETTEYTYDTNGNRLTKTGVTGTALYDGQDRIGSYGGATYQHNRNGDLVSKTIVAAATRYDYDVFGNLRHVTLPDNTEIDYIIDGASHRVGKLVNANLVQAFLYESQLRPSAELDGAGNVVSRFIYATKANVPDLMIRGGRTFRVITDHLGSLRLVVDTADGRVVQRTDYDEFGMVINEVLDAGWQPVPFGFAGGLFDRDTGLILFGARNYDPESGRWTARDPIGFGSGETNLFVYAGNNPVDRTDPTGLDWVDRLIGLGDHVPWKTPASERKWKEFNHLFKLVKKYLDKTKKCADRAKKLEELERAYEKAREHEDDPRYAMDVLRRIGDLLPAVPGTQGTPLDPGELIRRTTEAIEKSEGGRAMMNGGSYGGGTGVPTSNRTDGELRPWGNHR